MKKFTAILVALAAIFGINVALGQPAEAAPVVYHTYEYCKSKIKAPNAWQRAEGIQYTTRKGLFWRSLGPKYPAFTANPGASMRLLGVGTEMCWWNYRSPYSAQGETPRGLMVEGRFRERMGNRLYVYYYDYRN